ncbi:hypothetical protein ACNSPG_15740 [Brucella pituitosa]|uniref:hypothetical protein n=1 Tax=Brucella pituitosa TaxID=571256 RepID=UPI003C72E9F5
MLKNALRVSCTAAALLLVSQSAFALSTPNCKVQEIENFVKNFSHDIAIQEASTAKTVIFESMDMEADPEPKKVSRQVPLADVEWPVMPDVETLAGRKRLAEYKDGENGNKIVVIKGTDNGEYMEFEFAKQPCWTLVRVSDESM